jgi:hypothetical protein
MHLSAAHPTFPLPSYARVTNVETGSSVIVRVNDRGPYHEGRIIDLSNKTADMLDLQHSGTGKVRVQYVGRARMDGHDMPYLMASYVPKGSRIPGVNPEGQIATGVMVASNSRSASPATRSRVRRFYDRRPERAGARSATSYAGSTPSARTMPHRSPAARCHVLVAPSRRPSARSDQMVVLPEIGPMPYERPYGWQQGGSLAMGYQEEEREDRDRRSRLRRGDGPQRRPDRRVHPCLVQASEGRKTRRPLSDCIGDSLALTSRHTACSMRVCDVEACASPAWPCLLPFATGAIAADGRAAGFVTKAAQAYMIEAATGTVLLAKNEDQGFSPASLAKLMTVDLVFEALTKGQITLDTQYPVSEYAWRTGGAPSRDGNNVCGLKSRVRVEDLIKGSPSRAPTTAASSSPKA